MTKQVCAMARIEFATLPTFPAFRPPLAAPDLTYEPNRITLGPFGVTLPALMPSAHEPATLSPKAPTRRMSQFHRRGGGARCLEAIPDSPLGD